MRSSPHISTTAARPVVPSFNSASVSEDEAQERLAGLLPFDFYQVSLLLGELDRVLDFPHSGQDCVLAVRRDAAAVEDLRPSADRNVLREQFRLGGCSFVASYFTMTVGSLLVRIDSVARLRSNAVFGSCVHSSAGSGVGSLETNVSRSFTCLSRNRSVVTGTFARITLPSTTMSALADWLPLSCVRTRFQSSVHFSRACRMRSSARCWTRWLSGGSFWPLISSNGRYVRSRPVNSCSFWISLYSSVIYFSASPLRAVTRALIWLSLGMGVLLMLEIDSEEIGHPERR